MKLFIVDFTNQGLHGLAVVAAESEDMVLEVLNTDYSGDPRPATGRILLSPGRKSIKHIGTALPHTPESVIMKRYSG